MRNRHKSKEREAVESYIQSLKTTFNKDDIGRKFPNASNLLLSNTLYEMSGASDILKLRQEAKNTQATYIVCANFSQQNEFLYRPAMQYRQDVSHGGSHCGMFAGLGHID